MGCDIHSHAEIRTSDGWRRVMNLNPDAENEWERDEVFPIRNYRLFGFLADVRNYSHSPVIADPRGVPDDADLTAEEREEMADGCHSASWLTLAELLAYDYDQEFWDRREEGEGKRLPLREFLGEWYFRQLDNLAKFADPSSVRVVFWFDN